MVMKRVIFRELTPFTNKWTGLFLGRRVVAQTANATWLETISWAISSGSDCPQVVNRESVAGSFPRPALELSARLSETG